MNKIASALSYIPSDDRDTWVRMGLAVKSELGEEGFDLWDMWSRTSDAYKASSAKSVWRSISAFGKTTISTLYHLAMKYGWRDNGEQQDAKILRASSAARDAANAAEQKRKEAGYRNAAELSQRLIDTCKTETHYYLNAKGLPLAVGLVADGVLVVPMRDFASNALRGAQTIEWVDGAWEKKMVFGMRAKGAVLRLGNPKAVETFLCEGYATGLSIEMALRRLRLNASVLVCFSDSNMAHVASMVTGKAFVFADNDVSNAGEKAAVKTGFKYCMSAVKGNDANDDHAQFGLMHVCKMIMDVRRM